MSTDVAGPDGSALSDGLGHTHGPWHATTADEWRTANGGHAQWGRFDISAGSVDPEAEDYYRIASVSNVNNSPQNQANAKLIAAAPTLLKALTELLACHTESAGWTMSMVANRAEFDAMIERSQERLERAVGAARDALDLVA